jgi:low affinity Fe/Cu permease
VTRPRSSDRAGGRQGRAERLATAVARFAGTSSAFLIAAGLVVAWVVSGPIFHFSATWQLFINTGTTIVTFLMVFLIQRNQSKDALALQLKLNEIVAAVKGASNRLVNVEDLSEKELATLHAHYQRLADRARSEMDLLSSHSIEEADARHEAKLGTGAGRRQAK